MIDTRREKAVVFGGLPVIAILFYLLLGKGEAEEELVLSPPQAKQAAAPAPRLAQSQAQAQALQPQAKAAAPAAQAAAAPAAPAEGLRLHGVLGGGRGGGSAIIGYAGGAQRLVAAGRDVVPGLALREIARDHVVLEGPAGRFKLSLGGTSVASAAPGGGAPAAAGPTLAALSSPTVQRREAMQYRLGLAPRRANGRTTGYAVRPDATLPLLQRAGLQPGDVLVSVNGQSFDSDERVTDLPREIAGSYTAEIVYERGGRRMTARIPVNPRPM